MVWVKITNQLRIVDRRCHGHNNNNVVKLREQSWSWLKETNVD